MEFSERALILRVGKFREADLWVRLLTPSRGLFTAFAFGGSKSRRRFSGCLDLFNEVLFQIKSSGREGYFALQEGVLFKGPQRLRHDARRLGAAVNCALFTEAFGVSSERGPQIYALFIQLLNLLEEAATLPPLLPIWFRARLAFEQGYALNPRQCSVCGKDLRMVERAALPLAEGGIACAECVPLTGQVFWLGRESLDTLWHVLATEPGVWERAALSPAGQRECARAVEGFLQYHLGLTWQHGRFVHI